MKFTLTYRGPLTSNGNSEHKHEIRKHFHPQLRKLWDLSPLNGYKKNYPQKLTMKHHGFSFLPIVSDRIDFIAHISVRLLRPEEPPGNIRASTGDLDNRLKTLLDSLKVPHEHNALPGSIIPGADETPFYCLLSDDSLITRLRIDTDYFLEKVADSSEVLALIDVTATSSKSLIVT